MKNKRIAVMLIMGIFLISLASAECVSHQQKQTLEFSFSDTIANNCTVSTIDYPNGTIEIYQLMGKTSNTFNATILGGNFSKLGTYTINLECDEGYGNICRQVTEHGISEVMFIYYTIFYIILLFFSYLFVYKFATFNGGKLKDYSFFFWAAFFDLVIFVVIEVYGFGGADTLMVDVVKMLAFGSGAYFLAQGIFPAVSWKKSNYQ